MAIDLAFATGTQAATIATEHSLVSPDPNTNSGVYQLWVDVSAMLVGDWLELRAKEKAITGGTQRVAFMATATNALGADAAVWVSPPLTLGIGWAFTLKQTAGTGRSFPWSVRRIS